MLAAIGAVVVNTTLAAVLVGPLGLPGIALAIAIAAWLEAGALIVLLRRREGPLGLAAVASVAVADRRSRRRSPGPSASFVHGIVGPALAPGSGDARPCRIPGLAAVIVARVDGVRRRRSSSPRSPCGSRNCALSSRSWSTRSAGRAGRDGPDRRRTPGTPSSSASDPGSYLQLTAGRGSRPSTAGRRTGCSPDRPGRRAGPRPSAPAAAVGLRLRAARPGRRRLVARRRRRVHDGGPRATCRRVAGRVSHLRIDPEIEVDGPHDAGRRDAPRPAAARLAAGAADPARRRRGSSTCAADEDALWGDLRKKWRQYVNKARSAGVVVVDADGDRLGEFYRIYRETADRAGLPHPHRGGLPRRLGGVPAGRPRPAAVRPDGRRRAARDAVPRPLRDAGSSSRTAA